jgi:hypothetical protein
VRHRDNADRLIAGGVLGVAEVVKGLHSLSRFRPLPTKEREQYDNARHLLVHEIAVSLGVPQVLAEDFVDFALMPPAGVKFDLKPPPKPVLLPSRPKKRRPTEEEADDLGLGDLGIDLDLAGAIEGAAAAGDGEVAEEGEGAEAAGESPEAGGETAGAQPEGGEEPAEEAELPPEPASAREKPAAKAARAKAPAPKPAKAAKKPAAKKPAKAAAKPAKAAAKTAKKGKKK